MDKKSVAQSGTQTDNLYLGSMDDSQDSFSEICLKKADASEIKEDRRAEKAQSTGIESIMPTESALPSLPPVQSSQCTCGMVLDQLKSQTTIKDDTLTRQQKHLDCIKLKGMQKAVLENAYLKDPNWDTLRTAELAQQLGVGYKKVYKWNWERKKKELRQQARQIQ